LKRLSMFVLRAKCKLTDATDDVALVGAAGTAATALVGDASPWSRLEVAGSSAIRLPDGAGTVRALVAGRRGRRAPGGGPAATRCWRWLEVESGVVAIEAATADRFVPQMANHELVGAVDFRKGCFPGQEVVARSQYRGTTKRRTFLYATADGAARPGDDVHDPAQPNEPVGTVAMAAPHPSGRGGSALVELRLASHGSTELRLGSIDGPRLVERPLPYAVLLEAAAAPAA
jgi:folate-binding protein YgfZ